MKKEHVNAAWQGKGLPGDIPKEDTAPYLMLRKMYEDYKAGKLTGKQGERIKRKIVRYVELEEDGKAVLLEYFMPLLESDVPTLKLLSREYCRVTGGNRPYVKNTILEG